MLINKLSNESRTYYTEILGLIGSLSKLFSDSEIPYLNYRVTENLFCDAFDASNESRTDCSADAVKGNIGIGIKTFVNGNGRSFQKVAEFNSEAYKFRGKEINEVVKIVSEMRNERIEFTKRLYNLEEIIYHCIVRDERKISVFECNMNKINIEKIMIQKASKNSIHFKDDKEEYSINLSKSTLYKRFITKDILESVNVEIIQNPIELLTSKLRIPIDIERVAEHDSRYDISNKEYVILPLFSDKGERHVPSKSSLNQWNAGGRKRDKDEAYISIPSWIHKKFPEFFPDRDKCFNLKLPDGQVIRAKVCQDGGKALMSNPNLDLGRWILRKVLNLNMGELLTYDRLESLGIDSVAITKENDLEYHIDFMKLGSYDNFLEENN